MALKRPMLVPVMPMWEEFGLCRMLRGSERRLRYLAVARTSRILALEVLLASERWTCRFILN